MKTNTQKKSFNQIIRHAKHLAQRSELVIDKDLPHGWRVRYHAKRLRGIHVALETISATPNCSVSRELLEAWVDELDDAEAALEAWAHDFVHFPLADPGELLASDTDGGGQ